MDKPFLSEQDNNLLSPMFPDGWKSLKEDKEKIGKERKVPSTKGKDERGENWRSFIGGLRP